ncbi:hypothetical protein [Halalkalibacter nanhaiisediminis]|uniref:DUF4025 domain-containing protein n=1 Tax=Halalkalibacter nanhaiisediminis TaxID=688079 RepID=A0A562QMG4_9BACI|nr:hypothetical protein [Halalkalibacter nanhaiisediminis]TWI57929.1 hypothetical protein IQ10_01258 [Halalkalibacter nanhaiisediminis]
MHPRKRGHSDEPTIATGIDDDEELSQKASLEDMKKGDYTRVISLTDNDES